MLSPLRNRFGIPGVISVIALVFAMLGGAYAASDNGGSSNATASAKKKAKKGPRGPRGPKGPAGPAGAQGPAGPQGPAGAQGAKGDKGDKGDTGNAGSNGVSAKTKTFAGSKGSCTEGGIEVESASPTTLVCNGKKGVDGSPWTVGGTLPSGETLKGNWSFGQTGDEEVYALFSISFGLKYPGETSPTTVYVKGNGTEQVLLNEKEGEVSDRCPSASNPIGHQEPQAAPGYLCFYEVFALPATFQPVGEGGSVVNKVGATLFVVTESEEEGGTGFPKQKTWAFGTWAVTAP